MILLILIVIVPVLIIFVGNRVQKYKLRTKMGLGGPPISSFWLGNMGLVDDIFTKTKNQPYKQWSDWFDKYGKIFGLYEGPELVLQCIDLDIAKEILIKRSAQFTDRFHSLIFSLPPMSDSLLGQRGSDWKHTRAMVTPAFSGKKMKEMSNIIEKKLKILISSLGKHTEKEAFNIYDTYQALTLDVIGRCAFAMETDCQRNDQDLFYINSRKFVSLVSSENATIADILAVILPELNPIFRLLNWRQFLSTSAPEKWLIDNLKTIMVERKRKYKEFSESTDILQLLLNDKQVGSAKLEVSMDEKDVEESENIKPMKHKKLSDPQIIGNIYGFMLAGYETTSTALAFATWLLAKNQHVQQSLIQEIDDKMTETVVASYEDTKKMPYLDAVFKETLRIFPPVNSFCTRTCVDDCYVGGIHFTPGVQITFPIWHIHHDPNYWNDPDKFDPSRFLDGSNLSHPLAWMPFGGGQRNCVGMRFAYMEFKMAMASLFKHFTVHLPVDQEDLDLTVQDVLNRPKDGIVKVELRRRNL